ncbi:resolvase domain-containing protein, partial [Shewanella decolorationis S12]
MHLLTQAAKGNRFHPDTFTFGGILQGQRIGYVRVSSFDQNPDRQLEQIDVGKVFTDKASGKDTQRPELERLRSEEHTSELQSHSDLVCRLLLEKK